MKEFVILVTEWSTNPVSVIIISKVYFFSELPQKVEKFTESDLEVVSDENGHKFLEVVYVGDHLITEQIGLIELPDMLLIIGNIVSKMKCIKNNI